MKIISSNTLLGRLLVSIILAAVVSCTLQSVPKAFAEGRNDRVVSQVEYARSAELVVPDLAIKVLTAVAQKCALGAVKLDKGQLNKVKGYWNGTYKKLLPKMVSKLMAVVKLVKYAAKGCIENVWKDVVAKFKDFVKGLSTSSPVNGNFKEWAKKNLDAVLTDKASAPTAAEETEANNDVKQGEQAEAADKG
ncbi:hypothetical protein [Streptomyces sirii]|uniref:hypothetical protein n=1 Tax=Streptomyces sirii TaxID=3127701 RepID=UPI003D35F753